MFLTSSFLKTWVHKLKTNSFSSVKDALCVDTKYFILLRGANDGCCGCKDINYKGQFNRAIFHL